MTNGLFNHTNYLANMLLRAMSERHKENPLTKELKKAHSEFFSSVFSAEHNALEIILFPAADRAAAENRAAEIKTNYTALMAKIHESLNFLYQTAKGENPSTPQP